MDNHQTSRRGFLRGAVTATAMGVGGAALPGCGLVRNRYEFHQNQPNARSIIFPYDSSTKPPLLTGNAIAMPARDYKKFAEKYGLIAEDVHTIRPGIWITVRIKGKPEYTQTVYSMNNVDLYGLGIIPTVGRPFEAVREKIKSGYAALLKIEDKTYITVNLDKPFEGEKVIHSGISFFDATGAKRIPLIASAPLDRAMAIAGYPRPYHEWNEIAITRRTRNQEFKPVTVKVDTEKGKRKIQEVVLIADLEGAITGKGNSLDSILLMHDDRIFLATEKRPWPVLLRDFLREVHSITGSAAGIGANAVNIDGVVGYFEKSRVERR